MHPYAGFWKRFAAYLIDTIITSIVIFVVAFLFGFAAAASNPGISEKSLELLGNVIGIVLTWLYFSVMESSPLQATLGKMALGIRVTDMEGKRISLGRATGRHFGKAISAILLLVGYLMAGWTEKKQALHDMMASCLVVNRQ